MKLILGIIGIVTVAGAAVLWYSVYGRTQNGEFLLVNKAREPIALASVAICGQMIELKDVPPGKSAPGSFKISCEGHYTIEVEFQSGKKLRKETGYVTSGIKVHDEIVATDADVDIAIKNPK